MKNARRHFRHAGLAGALMVLIEMAAMPQVKGDELASALIAKGPQATLAGSNALMYAPLIGDWKLRVVDHGEGGRKHEYTGELLFRWVLEGRATQDLWIAPPRDRRGPAGPPIPAGENFFGTTLRVYDPAQDLWRITWIHPLEGVRKDLIGKRQGEEIVHDGKDGDGHPIRWIFSDLSRDSFRWRGEQSPDEGKSWTLVSEVFGSRK